jgi:hypothetical protein
VTTRRRAVITSERHERARASGRVPGSEGGASRSPRRRGPKGGGAVVGERRKFAGGEDLRGTGRHRHEKEEGGSKGKNGGVQGVEEITQSTVVWSRSLEVDHGGRIRPRTAAAGARDSTICARIERPGVDYLQQEVEEDETHSSVPLERLGVDGVADDRKQRRRRSR